MIVIIVMVMKPFKLPSIILIIIFILLILHLSEEGPVVANDDCLLIAAGIDQRYCPVLGLLAP